MKYIPYSHQCIDSGDIREVVKALKSDWLTQGPKIKEFEDSLCKYAGAKYAVVVSSGTAALHLACLAAGIKKGNEVITSPVTFVASANAVLYCGAKPVFADVQSDTININPLEISKKITKRTKALIPVHFTGHPCELSEIKAIAKKNKLLIIEDATHALGAEYKGAKIGSCKYSDMVVFSFHPVKSITAGEGGAVLTNNRNFYEKLLMLRNHGITKDKKIFNNSKILIDGAGEWYYEMQDLGFNYRITDFQCALGISQLKKIDSFIKQRRQIGQIYNGELSKLNDIVLPVEKNNVKSSYHLYAIRLRNPKIRKRVYEQLRKEKIFTQVHYIPVHLQPYYRKMFGYEENSYPVAENYYNRALSLPIYPGMTKREIEHVIDKITAALRKY